MIEEYSPHNPVGKSLGSPGNTYLEVQVQAL